MKGIVLDSFIDFVEDNYGIEVVNQIEEKLGNSLSFFTLSTYSDKEFLNILNELCIIINENEDKIQFKYGEYFFNILEQNYGHYFHKSNIIDFLIYLEDYIHPEVEQTMEDSKPPSFDLKKLEDKYELIYSSERRMPDFAFGLLTKCNIFFGNKYLIEKSISKGNQTVFFLIDRS